MQIKVIRTVTLEIVMTGHEAANLHSYLKSQPKTLKCGFKQLGQEEADGLELALKEERRNNRCLGK